MYRYQKRRTIGKFGDRWGRAPRRSSAEPAYLKSDFRLAPDTGRSLGTCNKAQAAK